MNRELIKKVSDWHIVFKQNPPNNISQLSEFTSFRDALFFEELEEYFDAGVDLIERADAICDMMYIIAGSIDLCERSEKPIKGILESYLHKLNLYFKTVELILELPENKLVKDKFDELFDEVLRSNYSKLEDGKVLYREDGKIMKGKSFSEPNLKLVMFK